jgi:hypothetical protein
LDTKKKANTPNRTNIPNYIDVPHVGTKEVTEIVRQKSTRITPKVEITDENVTCTRRSSRGLVLARKT